MPRARRPIGPAVSALLLGALLCPRLGSARPPRAGRLPAGRLPVAAPLKKGSPAWKRQHRRPLGPVALLARVGWPTAPVITVRNLHTGEVLAVPGVGDPSPALVNRLLRCRWTGRHGQMDPRLITWALQSARHFGAFEIQVVSAFRHPKFNEVLRKKGHEVARRSLHRLGQALDFRLVGVDVPALVAYLKRRRLGGVGRYPDSRFVHLDTGRFRTWIGR